MSFWRGWLIIVLVVQAACQSGPPSESYIERLRGRAEAGSAPAQFRMGGLYFSGEGVLENYEEAAKWLRLAAEQGHARAQEALGRICYAAVVMRRLSELKERRQRLEERLWGTEGSDRPNAEAVWMECDAVEAYAWLSLAASQGQETADEKREKIREEMTAAEIIQAQELAAEIFERIESSRSQ